ncbi:MAG: TIGR03663 family protein, partial [Chloroflexota bacterium]|nr:TIGR03663 family protein [Chloroflexota bacterium]
MRKSAVKEKSFLDIPLLGFLNPRWEMAVYALLIALAFLTRFWDLGARAISHDESLHALYSWKLYAGEGYRHTPMMHGPFLFHANAFIYFLFGANDYTARIVPALFGVAAVALPYFLRKWLGRTGALVTSALILISPSLLYYSRYIRHDILVSVWMLLMVIALFKYIDERKNRWLYLGAAALALSLCTKEVTYIFGFIVLTFILLAVLWEWADEQMKGLLRGAGTAVTILVMLSTLFIAKTSMGKAVLPYMILLTGFTLAALAVGRLVKGRSVLLAL